ncbi:MAG: DUF5011 domain-containing protein [Bacilli bacterium]|nr:DUF5011 domain-containing protein [Bacilli bacterium]
MNKKGFTLVELLAAIIILGILALLIVPTVLKTTDQFKEEAYKNMVKNIENAARLYVDNHKTDDFFVPEINIPGSDIYISLQDLIDDGSIKAPITDPKTDSVISGTTLILIHVNEKNKYNIAFNYNLTDKLAPIITMLGASSVSINQGDTYSDAGATATDNNEGDITSSIGVTSNLNPNVPGTYTVIYSVSDASGNITTKTRTVTVVDIVAPSIAFGTNGNATYAKSRSTTVTVNDAGGLNTSSLKYQIITSSSAPDEGTFSNSFTNGGTINLESLTGSYYLWILAKDTSNNTTITKSNVFNLDNTAPVITMLGSSPVTLNIDDTYSDAGATATDGIDGNITSSINTTSSVNPSAVGTYTVTYEVSDSSGNVATPVVRTVNVVLVEYLASKGVNRPKLATGMTAIKWNTTTSTWDTISNPNTDTSWYNYTTTDKQWANAKTADGSMWVWIPRYIYKISSGWHTKTAGVINIQFIMGVDDTLGQTVTLANTGTANDSNNTWTNHPAFTFGTVELTGIWVAKFEASNAGSNTVKIVPGVLSWRSIVISDAFTYSRNMETKSTYGWGTTGSGIDTHLTKNVEWGATSYLAQSVYGKNASITSNSTTYTGSGSGTLYITNVAQSSTGNIYGIYDLKGGSYEWSAAYVDNNGTTIYTNVKTAPNQYKDVYSMGTTDTMENNYILMANKKGDATYETTSSSFGSNAWYSESIYTPATQWMFFYHYGPFSFADTNGYSTTTSFRPILAVNAEL